MRRPRTCCLCDDHCVSQLASGLFCPLKLAICREGRGGEVEANREGEGHSPWLAAGGAAALAAGAGGGGSLGGEACASQAAQPAHLPLPRPLSIARRPGSRQQPIPGLLTWSWLWFSQPGSSHASIMVLCILLDGASLHATLLL